MVSCRSICLVLEAAACRAGPVRSPMPRVLGFGRRVNGWRAGSAAAVRRTGDLGQGDEKPAIAVTRAAARDEP
jgi:hypothetical protein